MPGEGAGFPFRNALLTLVWILVQVDPSRVTSIQGRPEGDQCPVYRQVIDAVSVRLVVTTCMYKQQALMRAGPKTPEPPNRAACWHASTYSAAHAQRVYIYGCTGSYWA